uniref:Basement membrane-specific heparan sulfate proteoglycan core protein-like n=1 Tax=Salarias fasciatus TaxID=181472 RepID=A0A672GSK6_SALFA
MDLSPTALILCSLLCSVAAQAPVVSVEPKAATVRQGESASFRCQVSSGAPPVQVEWRRANNQELPENGKVGPDGSVLTIANARPGNQGQYRCVASNRAGRAAASVVLNVKYAPKVELTPAGPLRVRMGESVSVGCQASGRPRPKLSWKRQGSTLQLVTTETDNVNSLQVKREVASHFLLSIFNFDFFLSGHSLTHNVFVFVFCPSVVGNPSRGLRSLYLPRGEHGGGGRGQSGGRR